jgi:hypothetical protein
MRRYATRTTFTNPPALKSRAKLSRRSASKAGSKPEFKFSVTL